MQSCQQPASSTRELPNPNSDRLVVELARDGKLFVASNLRTNYLSFVDVASTLAGENGAEVARVALAPPS